MEQPPLLQLETVGDYKNHYEQHYCRGNIVTADGIRIYFTPQKFGHAFYENTLRKKGPKDEFSKIRAECMDWIKSTLEHPEAELYMGWNKEDRCHEENRRVSVVYENFIVVIELSLNQRDELKGNFVTCYVADKSITQIRNSPEWNKEQCLAKLRKNKNGR